MADDRPPPHKPPFSRSIAPDHASSAQLQGRIEASAAELAKLAAFYRVDGITQLALDYSLDPLPSARWRLTGELTAELTQLCGVTLEPVPETIREDVSLEFWPEHLIAREDAGRISEADDILDSDPPEPIVNGRIDLGHLAGELFASALNPYPRKAGVEFDWTDSKAAAAEAASKPFAALARLKAKD